jgi:trehalose 6-phosphate synthase
LWPLLHGRVDLVDFDEAEYGVYREVNERFAAALAESLTADDLVWVHDYHLIPLATALRRLRPNLTIGFFLHVPFPDPNQFRTVGPSSELFADLCAYDLIGFQTRRDWNNFQALAIRSPGAACLRDGTLCTRGRTIQTGVFPIGVDPDLFQELAQTRNVLADTARIKRHVLNHGTGIISVDRLDYTKGVPERVAAFEMLLDEHPEFREEITLAQVAAPSRETVAEYQELRAELDRLIGSLNGRYATLEWVPVHHFNRTFGRDELIAFFRACRIALVTPLIDGMNLVAKEYVASQDPEDPGVLILSEFAGAAERLRDGILVNPYDKHAMVEAIARAVRMPLAERKERWEALMAALREESIATWRDGFLEALSDAGEPHTRTLRNTS